MEEKKRKLVSFWCSENISNVFRQEAQIRNETLEEYLAYLLDIEYQKRENNYLRILQLTEKFSEKELILEDIGLNIARALELISVLTYLGVNLDQEVSSFLKEEPECWNLSNLFSMLEKENGNGVQSTFS